MFITCSGMLEVLPPVLDSTSDQPPLFDGTTRLSINDMCPYAQRMWIFRNYKGLHDKIKLVPTDLQNRPAWYKEKVYPENKVPSSEHNDQVIGESLYLIKYVGSNFEGPALLPDDPAKQKFAEEVVSYSDSLIKKNYVSFKGDSAEAAAAEFDIWKLAFISLRMDHSSLVDVVYAPFVERFKVTFQIIFKHDFMAGRPKLAAWIEAIKQD